MDKAGASEIEAIPGCRLGALALVALIASVSLPAFAGERLVRGGYPLDAERLLADESASLPAPALVARGNGAPADGLSIELAGDGAFLTYFTPRLGGVRVGLGRSTLADDAFGHASERERLGVGLGYRRTFGGFELGLETEGGLDVTPSEPELRASFVVGGVLKLDDFGYGPVSARLAYGYEGRPAGASAGSASSTLSLSADLTVRPGIDVTGRLAIDDRERLGQERQNEARGLLGLRLRF